MNGQTPQTPGVEDSESARQVVSVAPLVSIDAISPVTRSDIRRVTRSVAEAAAEAGLSIEEIASLFEVAGSEDEAMRQLDGGVALRREVQRAKAEPRQIPPTKLRAALEPRAGALRGATA
jgi:hypothetical protein